MNTKKFNLACPEGHRWFARNPDAWVGKVCGQKEPHAISGHGCQLKLKKTNAPVDP